MEGIKVNYKNLHTVQCTGWVDGNSDNKANSAQLKLPTGTELGNIKSTKCIIGYHEVIRASMSNRMYQEVSRC